MNMEYFLFEDEIYGFTAIASSKTMAWAMIRNKCHFEKLKVPMMDKIKKVKKIPIENVKALMNNKKS